MSETTIESDLALTHVRTRKGAKIPVLGFSMDDSSNAEDMQDDAPSEPNKRMSALEFVVQ